jgi:aminopeptidase-like protein
MELKPILERIYPLHRTLASDGTDEALRIIQEHLPPEAGFEIETYTPGTPVWTWQVPERYVVHEAYLETEAGSRVADFSVNSLHLVSYSLPVDQTLTWEELRPHLFFNEDRPHTIPWVFKYYLRDWGFCLSKDAFDRLDRSARYRAVIRSEFVDEPGFRVGVGVIHPIGGPSAAAGEMIVAAHVCHPRQANDDASGVVSAIGLAQRLAADPLPAGSMSVRFLFCPETIGSITYLAHHEDLIARLRGGIFLEMTGNLGLLAWHRTRQGNSLLDRVTASILPEKEFIGRDFAASPANDERVINGPGVDVPCISLNRWPYPEYHTSDDEPSIIREDMLVEAAEIAERIVRIHATDFVPKRTFMGPVFLSGNGLWVDWRESWELNRAIERIMMSFEGDMTVFEIAEAVGLDYWVVREYVEKFREKGFVEAKPV